MNSKKIAKKIISPYGAIIIGILLYFLSPSGKDILEIKDFGDFEHFIMDFTGTVATITMAFAIILAARFTFINKIFGGLDKAYIAHRRISEASFVFIIIHFSFFLKDDIAKKIENWGKVLAPKARKESFLLDQATDFYNMFGISAFTDLEKFHQFAVSTYRAGQEFIIQATVILIAVVIIAMMKRFSYYTFRITHKLIPLAFLFIAFHAITRPFRYDWLVTIPGFLYSLILIPSAIVAFMILFGLHEIGKRYKTTVKNIKYHEKEKLTEVELELTKGSFNFIPGQFVFISFNSLAEPHPFSIANYDKDKKVLKFYIKKLGDYTEMLSDIVKVGDTATIVGPFGGFDFNEDKIDHNQIWIAGGIGVTPFISRLEYLANSKNNDNRRTVFILSYIGDLFLKNHIEELCKKANVEFHYNDTKVDGKLSFDKISNMCPEIKDSSIWFCGPKPFLNMIQDGVKNNNYDITNIHYDNFAMR